MSARGRLVSLVAFVFLVTSFAYADGKDDAIQALIAKIRPQLRTGWVVSCNKNLTCMEVERPQLVAMDTWSASRRLVQAPYVLSLDIVPYLSVEDYKKVHDPTQRKYDSLVAALRAGKVDNVQRGIDESERLGDALRSLPDYYFQNVSLRLRGPFGEPVDDLVRRECEEIRNNVLSVLSKY